MRLAVLLLLIFTLCPGFGAARAEDASRLTGQPVVLDSGTLMLGGYNITLWGIDTLADDQQCWHGKYAWDCGEQATLALKHYLEGRLVRCAIKFHISNIGGGKVIAQCFRLKGKKEIDIARYLVSEGWARDQSDASGGLYAKDESEARRKRRGIWTSRFQTAEDWKNGTSRYIEYQQAPEPARRTDYPSRQRP